MKNIGQQGRQNPLYLWRIINTWGNCVKGTAWSCEQFSYWAPKAMMLNTKRVDSAWSTLTFTLAILHFQYCISSSIIGPCVMGIAIRFWPISGFDYRFDFHHIDHFFSLWWSNIFQLVKAYLLLEIWIIHWCTEKSLWPYYNLHVMMSSF